VHLVFHCGDATGTFYIRVLSYEEIDVDPFVGYWIGKADFSGQPVTWELDFYDDAQWRFYNQATGFYETGTYSRTGNSASLTHDDNSFGTASVSGGVLTMNINNNYEGGGTGQFTYERINNDVFRIEDSRFLGTWVGGGNIETISSGREYWNGTMTVSADKIVLTGNNGNITFTFSSGSFHTFAYTDERDGYGFTGIASNVSGIWSGAEEAPRPVAIEFIGSQDRLWLGDFGQFHVSAYFDKVN
jgi:hypothetical protein